MELSKGQKIILGICTLIPLLLVPVVVWQVFHGILNIIELNEFDDPAPRKILMEVFSFAGPMLLLIFISFMLVIFYIVHAVTNKRLQPAEQVLWVLLFIFFSGIAFPVYWIVRIWNNSDNP